MLFADAYAEGRAAALSKFAATRGMKEIRNAVAGGNMDRANMLAKTPGLLSQGNTMGSQIKDLGAGSEGLATLVAHPEHGVSVRKMFDPNAVGYSPELAARKQQLGSLPGSAAHLGATATMHNTPVHFNEFVQGQQASKGMTPDQQQQYQRAMVQSQRGARQQGMQLRDMRPENAVVTPEGGVKMIDSLPFKPGETESNATHSKLRHAVAAGRVDPKLRNAVLQTHQGAGLFPGAPGNYPAEVTSRNPAQFKQYMMAGNVMPSTGSMRGTGGTSLMPPSNPMGAGQPSSNRRQEIFRVTISMARSGMPILL